MQIAERIDYTMEDSALGPLMVARSEKGVCAILIGHEERALLKDLKKRFPKASFSPGGTQVQRAAKAIARVIQNPKTVVQEQWDVRGTDFQRKVWRALQDIPLGQTASYREIATAIGAPRAVRAVAGACAANALAIVIPCHRVIRSDGGLSGYYWGVPVKEKLLRLEGVL